MGFVDNDEAELFDGCEEGGTGADDDLGLVAMENVFPCEMTSSFGLFAVEEGDVVEMGLEILDKLGGEGDFGDEDDGGFMVFEGLAGEF